MSLRGANAPARGGAVLATSRRTPSAADVRASYSKRLEDLVQRMADAFKNLMASAQVRDSASNARAEFETQVEAANLTHAAEGLLRLISELKTAAIVQDVQATNQEAQETKTGFENETRQVIGELKHLRDNVAATLSTLEKHYYSSMPYLTTPPDAQPSE